MPRGLLALWTLTLLLALTSCQASRIFGDANDLVDRVDLVVEKSVREATDELDATLERARVETAAAVTQAREEYESALAVTGEEVSRLREEFKRDLDALEKSLGVRIAQAEAAALNIVKTSDAAVQARIDQAFTELRLFVRETLAQIRELILPVLTLAERLSGAVESSQEAIEKLTEKLLAILDEVKTTFATVRTMVEKFDKPFTGEGGAPKTPLEAILALIAAAGTIVWKFKDKWGDKRRWNESELSSIVFKHVEEDIKSGKYDIYLRERLVALGVLEVKTKPNGGEGHG